MCSLLGNVSKHGDAFYVHMLAAGLLPLLVDGCADADGATRKLACFAVGNAGFHSAVLYEHLGPAVPALVCCLRDEDAKTRANAAGALGNLARNGPQLCGELLAHEAGAELLALARRALPARASAALRAGRPEREGRGGAEAVQAVDPADLAAARIALFSLGNLAAHQRCGEALQALSLPGQLADLQGLDSTLLKYSLRITQKLDDARPNNEVA